MRMRGLLTVVVLAAQACTCFSFSFGFPNPIASGCFRNPTGMSSVPSHPRQAADRCPSHSSIAGLRMRSSTPPPSQWTRRGALWVCGAAAAAPVADMLQGQEHRDAKGLGLPLQTLTDECEIDACINRDKRVFNRAGRRFQLRQEFDKNGSRSTGSAVWEGDVVLTKYMDKELPRDYWKGKTVLELGAGIGFAGMVAALLGAKDVVLTDGDDRVLDLARRNVDANLKPEEVERSHLIYERLRWEWAADPSWRYDTLGGRPIDVILAADLSYYKDNIPPLITMMRALCGPNTEILLTHTVRPTDGDSMQQFYKAFEVQKINSGPSFDGHPETFMYRMRAKAGTDAKIDEGSLGGCKAGYVYKKAINLCVPAPQ